MGLKKFILSKLVPIVTATVITTAVTSIASINAEAVGGASDSVKANENGVIKIECVYGDDNFLLRSCTGFIINNSSVITSKEILGRSAESILRDQYGSNFRYDKSKLKYRTKISGIYINATDALDTTDTDNAFAVLRLGRAIDFDKSSYKALSLGSSSSLSTTETVYTIGYSTTDNNSTVINEGKISKIDNNYIEYTMNNPTAGFIGSPVINENGGVVALTVSLTSDGYRSIPIDNIKSVLNTFTIDYTTATSNPQPPIQISPDEPDTPDIIQSSPDIIQSSPDISINNNSITDVVPEAQEDNTMIIIIIAAIGAVVVVLIVVIIIIATKKKTPTAVQGGQNFVPPTPMPRPEPAPTPIPYPPTKPTNPVQMGSEGETALLNEGSAETTILGGSATIGVPSGILVNTKKNEKIVINKPEFAIGKERNKVDYAIEGENSVSRLHAKIRVRAGKCYLMDMGSKNGTYINGNKIDPNAEVLIQNGDKIKFSVVEYEFRN